MSIRDELWSIISAAKSEHEAKLHQALQAAGHSVAQFSAELQKGAAWLRSHVLPVLTELQRCLAAEHVSVEIGDHLLPTAGNPSHRMSGPALSVRLVAESPTPTGEGSPRSQLYIFHCDGEFLNITHGSAGGMVAIGRPFDVETSPADADAIVLAIIRTLLHEYFESTRKALLAELAGPQSRTGPVSPPR